MDNTRSVDSSFNNGLIAGVLLGLFLAALASNTFSPINEFVYGINLKALAPVAVDIGLTVLVLDRLSEWRERERRNRDLKARLIREMSSSDNGIAQNAVSELQAHGWLLDGALQEALLLNANLQKTYLADASLQGAKLAGADLQEAYVADANLQGANLTIANLQETAFRFVNLQEAYLIAVNLQGADLLNVQLQRAILGATNLQDAFLDRVNLQEAYLADANLQGVKLRDRTFDEKTVLPDYKNWTSSTDMARFTNPNHSNFWRSDNPESPAYWSETQNDGDE